MQQDKVGPSIVAPGQSYTITETAANAGTRMSRYDSKYQCVNASGTVVVSGAGTSISLPYPSGAGQAITCTFTNTPKKASVTLAKKWKITGQGATEQVIDHNPASPPAGLASTLTTQLNGATAQTTAWGSTRSDVFHSDQLALAENVTLSGAFATCTWEGADVATSATAAQGGSVSSPTITGSGTATGSGTVTATIAGNETTAIAQTVTVTNKVNCQQLTLSKAINHTAGGTAVPADWNGKLIATPTAGTPGTAVTFNHAEAKPLAAGSYVLSETAVTGYEQASITCTGGTYVEATKTLTLAKGTTAACTITNREVLATAAWTKVDGGGRLLGGSTWRLTGPGGAQTVIDCTATPCAGPDTDPAKGVFKIANLAWGNYTLVETVAPPGFILDPTPRPFTVGPSNLNQAFAAGFTNQQAPAVALPLTGGTGADLFRYGGPALVLMALLAAAILRRRRANGRAS